MEFGVFRPTREFFIHLETSPLPVKGCKFWPMLGTYGQWVFFHVPHLLWHGAPVYNGHLRGPVTLTPIAFQLAVEQSLPVLKAKVCCGWESNTQPYACRAIALTHCATAASTCIVPYFTDIREYLNAMKHSIELCLLYRRVFTLNYRITQQCYKSSI